MKLYGFPPTRSTRVLWTLRELDVEFEFVNVDPIKGELMRPEFLAVNPAGKLPALGKTDIVGQGPLDVGVTTTISETGVPLGIEGHFNWVVLFDLSEDCLGPLHELEEPESE